MTPSVRPELSLSGFPRKSVRPELVEGLSSLFPSSREGQGFDKLSPNGCAGRIREVELSPNGVTK